ncbi:MAG TPA: hypothetical protein VGP72_07050 [Planctomycetota bacterium]|jgi:hypothetical protein
MSQGRFAQLILASLAFVAWVAIAEEPAPPENLAPKAKISSNSEHNADYLAKFVADGKIPECNSHDDLRQAWCVKGDTHRNGAELTFEWDAPVTIAQIVYYGRTSWMTTECWKDYEVFLDGSAQAAMKGQFQEQDGPQRVNLAAPAQAKKLTLKFNSSYGGMNPGAHEVQIYSVIPPLPKVLAEADSVLRRKLIDGKLGFKSFVVIQRRELNPSHVYTYHVEGFGAGGGLCVFTPAENEASAELKQLVASPEGQILDCDVSYDGQEILFSLRKSAAGTYQVYRIKPDGSGLTQITDNPWHSFNACWLPDGGIGFLSTQKQQFAYCWTSPVGTLHRMDRDGKNVKRLSANYLNDFTPAVMNDGRIIYSRWEYVDRPAIPIQSLWAINADGTNLAGYYGNRVLSPATFMEPRPMPGMGNAVICTLTAHNGPCRGAIGIVDPGLGVNAQAAIRNLTPEVNIGKVDKGDGNNIKGPYENPYPIDNECFVVSRRGTLMIRDYDGTDKADILKPRNGIGFFSPTPIRTRTIPPLRQTPLPEKNDGWATVFCQDVYNGLEPAIKRGEVKQIAVVQEIEKMQLADLNQRAFGFQFPVVSCGATYAPKRIWGYVPVAEDGSAMFKVPTGMPIYFMALDAEGRAVQRMRSFTHMMPGETQGCVGCHESREQAPRRITPADAVKRIRGDPKAPTPPEFGLNGFSYNRIVQPVLDKYCVNCHNGKDAAKGVDLSGDMTDFFNVSYETLARENRRGPNKRYTSWICTENGNEANILIVAPKAWGSPASEVADLILSGHPDKDGKKMVEMDETSRRRVFAWIDLNVPYYPTSLFTHGDKQGCRRMYPVDLDKVLKEVSDKRCVECHKVDKARKNAPPVAFPRKVWTRVQHPEFNSFLTAPLAKSAGGTEKCGKAIFATKDDPDYQAILKTFEPVNELLKKKPREDMPGAEPPLPTCAPPTAFGE